MRGTASDCGRLVWSRACLARENQRHSTRTECVDDSIANGENDSEICISRVGRNEYQIDAAIVVDLAVEFVAERLDDSSFSGADTQTGTRGDRSVGDVDAFYGSLVDDEADSFGCINGCDSVATAHWCAWRHRRAGGHFGLLHGEPERDGVETDRGNR